MLPALTNQRWANTMLNPVFVNGGQDMHYREDENLLHLELDLPGFKKDEVKITLDRGVVNVDAQTVEVQGEARRQRQFSRCFRLSESYGSAEINARLEDGVLYLDIYKPEEAKPKAIEVQ